MERSSCCPWTRRCGSEQEKRTRTPSSHARSSRQVVTQFFDARNTLFQKDLDTRSGYLITRQFTRLMDELLHGLFLQAGFRECAREIQEEGVAVVALGSYGRRELCLGSDVDFLVIHHSILSPRMTEAVTRVLYSLWDAKLEVGHSVMTLQECIRAAMSDFRHFTSLLDMRLLMGSRGFFRLFNSALRSRCEREKGSLLGHFLIYQGKRVEKYGNQAYFMEPDIKEGLGGLRDIHSIAWLSKLYFNTDNLRQIKRYTVFSHFALERLHHSESFLLKVRNHLHRLAGGRREDRLLMPFQLEIARTLGYGDTRTNTGPERFMRDLYLHLNRIRYGSEEFRTRALDLIDPKPVEEVSGLLPAEFQVMRDNLVLKEVGSLTKGHPALVLQALAQANQRDVFLGSDLIWEAGHVVAKRGEELLSGAGKALFLELLLKPVSQKLLRVALEIGLIGLFIPELRRVRNLAQFSSYHVETVDLHSLRTMEVIHEISRGGYDDRWPVLREIFQDLTRPGWLHLAALLHDVGKGYKGDHSLRGAELVPRILARLELGEDAAQAVSFLVRHHLLLVNISLTRDLNDEKTSLQAAQTVENAENLKALLLLTVADSLATGPLAGSDWKIMLLIELYLKVRHIFEKGFFPSPDALKRVEEKKRNVLRLLGRRFPEREILQLMEQVSTRYFMGTRLDDMAEHLLLALTLGQRRFAWTLQKLKSAPVTRALLCTYDRPGLFSKMVGVFTLNNVDVLSGNIFTLKNGLALDIYEVTNPLDPLREKEMWGKIHRNIEEAVEGMLPLDLLIDRKERAGSHPAQIQAVANRVRLDNEASDFYTLIEVNGGGRAGLLYDLAKEIFSQGLDIRFARVNRRKDETSGVFYVRDAGGQKVSGPEEMANIERGILSVIG